MSYPVMDQAEITKLGSVVFVVLDSLRLDSFDSAETLRLDRLAPHQYCRHSYATWTQPSHTCLLGGLLPFESRPGGLAADVYRQDLNLWATALTGDADRRTGFVPRFCLAQVAREAGWKTIGNVSLPVLNEHTRFSDGFDEYALTHGGLLGSQVESVLFELDERRPFVFINCGDTHYPYALPHSRLPRLSGVHGAARRPRPDGAPVVTRLPFTPEEMRELHRAQIRALEAADRALEGLVENLPKPLLLVVASDHGELFGEEGYFGHGPFAHPLLTEVPLALGIVR